MKTTLRTFLLLVTALTAAASAQAETISLSTPDDVGYSSFTSGDHWNYPDGVEKVAPSSDYDYLVARNLSAGTVIRTPDTTADITFGGKSLTLGTDTSYGAFMFKSSNSKVTIPNFILHRAALSLGSPGKTTLGGAVTVEANKNGDPNYLSGNNSRSLELVGTLASTSADVTLSVLRHSLDDRDLDNGYTFYQSGDASGYTGKWIIDNLNRNGNPSPVGDNTTPVTMVVDGAARFGADPGELVSDRITIRNRGVLNVTGSALALGNRGLTVDATGARLTSTGDLTLSGTISGTGLLELNIAGTLTLDATFTGDVQLAITSTDKFIRYGGNFRWNSTAANPRDNNFSLPDDATVVYMTATGDDTSRTYDKTDVWADGSGAESGKHYIVNDGASRTLRTPGGESETFPGDSLTLYSDTDHETENLMIKSKAMTVNKLQLGARASVTFGAYNSRPSSDQTLSGNIVVSGTDTNPTYFRSSQSSNARKGIIAATVRGLGTMELTDYYDSGSYRTAAFAITGDLTGFGGKLRVAGSSDSVYTTLEVSDAAQLGGEMAASTADGIRLARAILSVTDSTVLNTKNRHLQIYRNATIKVASGKTFAVANDITVEGPNTLTVDAADAAVKLSGGSAKTGRGNAAVAFAAGTITIASESALAAVDAVSFADGTTLLVPFTGIGANGFLLEAAPTGTVAIDYDTTDYTAEEPPKTLALFSVKGTTATVTAPTVTFAKYPQYNVTLVAQDVTIGDEAYVRYSAQFTHTGFAIRFR